MKRIRKEIMQILIGVVVLHGLLHLYNELISGSYRSVEIEGVKISTMFYTRFIPIITLPIDIIRLPVGKSYLLEHRYIITYESCGVLCKYETPATEDLPVASPDTVRIVNEETEIVIYFKVNNEWVEGLRLPKPTWHSDPVASHILRMKEL